MRTSSGYPEPSPVLAPPALAPERAGEDVATPLTGEAPRPLVGRAAKRARLKWGAHALIKKAAAAFDWSTVGAQAAVPIISPPLDHSLDGLTRTTIARFANANTYTDLRHTRRVRFAPAVALRDGGVCEARDEAAASDRDVAVMAAGNYRTPRMSAVVSQAGKLDLPLRPEITAGMANKAALPLLFLPPPLLAAPGQSRTPIESSGRADSAFAHLEQAGTIRIQEDMIVAAMACDASAAAREEWIKKKESLTRTLAKASERFASLELSDFIAAEEAERALTHFRVAQAAAQEYATKPKEAALSAKARAEALHYEAWMCQQPTVAREELVAVEHRAEMTRVALVYAEIEFLRAEEAQAQHAVELARIDTTREEARKRYERIVTLGKRKMYGTTKI